MSPALNFILSALVRPEGQILLVEEQGSGDPSADWMLPGGKVDPMRRWAVDRR